MGLKLGYNFSPTSTTPWMMDNGNTLSNEPNVNVGGFYSRYSVCYKIRK